MKFTNWLKLKETETSTAMIANFSRPVFSSFITRKKIKPIGKKSKTDIDKS